MTGPAEGQRAPGARRRPLPWWNPRRAVPAVVLVLLLPLPLVLSTANPVVARQSNEAPPTASPETVVRDFNRAFQSAAWDGLAQRIHPEGLDYLRLSVDILVEYDRTGYFLDAMIGEATSEALAALDDDEVVVRAMRWIESSAPGLLSSLSGRRTEVVGTVEERDDRHVVYRTTQLAQGAAPELRVVTLGRHDGRWKVRTGRDLTFLHTALRGLRPPVGSDPSAPPMSADTLRPRGPARSDAADHSTAWSPRSSATSPATTARK